MDPPNGSPFSPVIDPVLIALSTSDTAPINTNSLTTAISGSYADSPPLADTSPFDSNGELLSKEAFKAKLAKVRLKAPLQKACEALQLATPRKATLARLCDKLAEHWYPEATASQPSQDTTIPPFSTAPSPPATPSNAIGPIQAEDMDFTPPYRTESSMTDTCPDSTSLMSSHNLSEEERLLGDYGTAGAEELLGYAGDGLDEEDEEADEDDEDDDDVEASPFSKFTQRVRVEAANRAEQNRRPGGRKAQKSVRKAWERFLHQALEKGELKDDIVDVHSLLLFIKWSAERPKLNRQGNDIPGTRIGASSLKRLFFGALRIRKLQDAADPTLALRRPATSVLVYDAIKDRMDEALDRVRNGFLPNEDAEDIIANTFLAEVTEEQLDRIGLGFLQHRELRMAINGHLAWTCQNASGNRGDDFRALKLCELQPYTWTHPNNETAVYSVLGLQGEEKAGKRGMKTKVNPVYSVFVGHRQPELCPLGAFAFYFHFLHDQFGISEKMGIDWTSNKSWRQVRVLFGTSPIVAYNESNLYNLYVQAYKTANFISKIKAHMPRRLLGYKQEQMGVHSDETSKLGWSRGTYIDTYAPALPKTAILGAHGYKVHENYSPPIRHVHVPERFLSLVCPMAESICESVAGKEGLVGAMNHWSMIIELRKYVFWCGAAVYQKLPNSSIFRLPALQDPDVRRWMTSTFPSEYAAVQAQEGSPVDLQRIQNAVLQQALEETRALLCEQKQTLAKLVRMIERRTAVLTPTQGFSNDRHLIAESTIAMQEEATITTVVLEPGVYTTEAGEMRACVNPPSPVSSGEETRQTTQVDFVLPPPRAFCKKDGSIFVLPSCLGKKGANWKDVFDCIHQYDDLWKVWGPSKTLNNYDLDGVWECYAEGEAAYDEEGNQTGKKPPLRLVEEYFHTKWRSGQNERKSWGRLKKIPIYIEERSRKEGVSPSQVIQRLKDLLSTESLQGLAALSRRLDTIDTPRVSNAAPLSPIPSSPSTNLGSPFRPTTASRLSPPPSSPFPSHHNKRAAISPLPRALPSKHARL